MKRLSLMFGVAASTLAALMSCGKDDTSWRDALLNDVAGEYSLVGYGWQGAPVDVKGDGSHESEFLPWLLDIKSGLDLNLDVSVTDNVFKRGYGVGFFPSTIKSYHGDESEYWEARHCPLIMRSRRAGCPFLT